MWVPRCHTNFGKWAPVPDLFLSASFYVSATARHIENGAGHIGCFVRHQPDNRVRDFGCRADALHRDHVAEPVRTVGLATRGVNVGIDQSGPDRRNTNAFACDLVSETDREGIDRTLRG